MSANRIAVDVALIPPDETIQRAVELNSTIFPDTGAQDYVLEMGKCIPRVTLLMGLITTDQVPEVGRKLRAVAEKFSPIGIMDCRRCAAGEDCPYHVRTPGTVAAAAVRIEKSPELIRLHEAIVDEMSAIFTYDGVDQEMFYSPPPLKQVPGLFAGGHARTNVREQYKPHMTIGLGSPTRALPPFEFTSSKLALCHLGNFCSCREILWSTSLS